MPSPQRVPTINPASYVTEQVVALHDVDGRGTAASYDAPLPVRVAATPPRLVPVPFSALDRIEVSGAAVAGINGNFSENDDGTQSGLDISLPASATFANAVQVRRVLNGNALSLRLSRRSNAGYNMAAPFGVMVDGQAIEVDWSPQPFPEQQATGNIAGAYRNVVFGTAFGDGSHDVRVSIPCDATTTRTLGLLGWLADENAGYRVPPRGVSLQDTRVTLNGTGKSYLGAGGGCRGLAGFYYLNASAAQATLDLFAATSAFAGRLQRLTVAAGANGYCALPGIVSDGIQLQASASGTFVVTPVGAM